MADENTELAPQGTPSPEPTEPQPPTGSAAPIEGTPEPTTQEPGTPESPEVLAQRKAFWQEKARQLAESAREAQAKLAEYESRFGPLWSAPTMTPPPVQTQGATVASTVVDPFDPNFIPVLEERIGSVIERKTMEIRYNEQMAARRANAERELTQWFAKNKIPEAIQAEVTGEYAKSFTVIGPEGKPVLAGTPEAFVQYVMDRVRIKMESDQYAQYAAQAAAEAAAKAKQLAGVAQPVGGIAPPPTTQEKKTWQDAQADKIAPPDPEPKFD